MNKNIGDREKYERRQKIKYIISWVAEIVAAVILAALFSAFFCKSVVVQEGSMEPTLNAGQKVLYDSASYSFSAPKRGDIIVFRIGNDENSSLHIKRVVGLPGETIMISDGQIFIDDQVLLDHHEFPTIVNPGIAQRPILLEEEEYFVLGDNRNNSEDSRHVGVGNVKKEQIVGKIWFTISPFSEFGFLND